MACARVSSGNGLPPDGHLVHAAFLGQASYYWCGRTAKLRVVAVPGTESEWNVASSRLPLVIEGDSATGKDNLVSVVLQWIRLGRGGARALDGDTGLGGFPNDSEHETGEALHQHRCKGLPPFRFR